MNTVVNLTQVMLQLMVPRNVLVQPNCIRFICPLCWFLAIRID
jgi:hypothetical protein